MFCPAFALNRMEVVTDSSIRLARYPQDTQQNNAVNLVSVLAYFHTTPSGVVFFGQEIDQIVLLIMCQKICISDKFRTKKLRTPNYQISEFVGRCILPE